MAIPDFQSLMLPALRALSGGNETSIAGVRARIAETENLKAEDLREIVPSGRQSVFTNRVSWAVIHMARAGLVERAAQQVQSELEYDVLERVRKAPPEFLEQVVIDFLIAMGYGGGDASM